MPSCYHDTNKVVLRRGLPQLIAQARVLDGAGFAATWKVWTDADALEAAGVFSEVLPAGGGKPGDEERALAGLAHILAALAFVPGGVTFGNQTYEASVDTEA